MEPTCGPFGEVVEVRKWVGPEGALVGIAVIPTTVMVLTGHTWIGAGTIGAVLAVWLAQVRIRTRAAVDSEKEMLSYAHIATNLGTDPTPVIKAMRHHGSAAVDKEDHDDLDDHDEYGTGYIVHVPAGRRH